MAQPSDLQNQLNSIQWTNGSRAITGAIVLSIFTTIFGILSGMGTWTNGVYSPNLAGGFVTATGGNSPRSLADMLGDVLNLQSKGAVLGLDVSSLLASLSPGRYTLTGGLYRVNASVTIPQGVVLDVSPGSGFTVDAGQTLTIKGRIDTRVETQVFFGAGTVVGLRYNRPVWWGANGAYGNATDSAPAFNACVASAEASFNPNNPSAYSDGGRPTCDFGGGGFYGIASPINIHPGPSQQLDFKGSGILNGGSRLDVMSSFTGDNAIDVHGVASGSNSAWDLTLRDFQVTDYNRKSSACIRFVPEGAGYGFNSGDERPSLIENVQTLGCPIGFDVANTLDLNWRRVSYLGIGNSNNTGIRLATAGGGSTSDVGEMTFDSIQLDACPAHNAAACTNANDMLLTADGTGTADGANESIAAITFTGNNIFWASGTAIGATANNGGTVADMWINNVQFDGVGCNYLAFRATGTGNVSGGSPIASSISDIHAYHNYHTAVAASGCQPHNWQSDTNGTMKRIFDQDNWMIGVNTSAAIRIFGVTLAQVTGNILEGGLTGGDGITVDGQSQSITVRNNNCNAGTGTPWDACVYIASATDYIVHGSNLEYNGIAENNISSGLHNDPPNPVVYAHLPFCNATTIGTPVGRQIVTDLTTSTPGSAVTTGGGNITRPVVCGASGSPVSYAWVVD